MGKFIETKLRYDKMNNSGLIKKVTESYLVDALTFTEAEAKIIAMMTPKISGEFTVNAVKKSRISEIYNPHSQDRFYLAKVGFVTIDERTATEKKQVREILIGASCFMDAVAMF